MNRPSPPDPPPDIHCTPVGLLHSPYREKFAIPRQPGLAPAAEAWIELTGACNREEIVRGLEGFSHLWLLFWFHESARDNWKPTVRPPRLGGNKKIGVFASRSPFRPNPIGLSAVTLRDIRQQDGHWRIYVDGADLLDQTPILDIKPYLPYADAHPNASGHYAEAEPELQPVSFSPAAQQSLAQQQPGRPPLQTLIEQVLAQQPQPAYHRDMEREYGVRLYDLNIRWRRQGPGVVVVGVEVI